MQLSDTIDDNMKLDSWIFGNGTEDDIVFFLRTLPVSLDKVGWDYIRDVVRLFCSRRTIGDSDHTIRWVEASSYIGCVWSVYKGMRIPIIKNIKTTFEEPPENPTWIELAWKDNLGFKRKITKSINIRTLSGRFVRPHLCKQRSTNHEDA